MASRSWIRNLFASRTPRTIRKAPARRQLHVEALEDRLVMNSYTAATAADLLADIGLANAAGGVNTITLTAPNSSPYALTAVNNTTHGATGLPVIAVGNNLTILGDGDAIQRSTASGTPAFRLFDVAAGATLTLKSLTLHDGWAFGTGVAAQGGAIYNSGTLMLDGVTVSGNVAQGSDSRSTVLGPTPTGPGANAYGGALYVAAGTATLTNGTLSGNIARGGNAGFPYAGGPSGAGGDALGGGVYVAAGTVTLTSGTLGDNLAQGGNGAQGGIGSSGDHGGAGGRGGNALGGGLHVAAGTVLVTNGTLSNNIARGGTGGDGGTDDYEKFFFGGAGGSGGVGQGGALYARRLSEN